MDTQGLVTSLSADPVTPLEPAGLGHIWVAAHSDPDDGQSLQRTREARLRSPSIEEHLVSDDANSSAGNGGDTLVPSSLGFVEYLAHADGTVRSKMD